MRKVTLRSLWEHKRRLVSTVLAILLGVAFLSGTFVFADTLDRVFDDLFADINENVDARVQGEVVVGGQGGGDERARFGENVVELVRGVDGVTIVEPFVSTFGFGPTNRVLDPEGDPIGASNGPPTILESWVDNEDISPYRLVEGGRAPSTADEITLNQKAAEDGGYELGDTVTVASQFGNAEYTLVGIFTFGEADSAAGAVEAGFTLEEAQRLAGAEGLLNAVLVGAGDGISQAEIVERIAPVLPAGTEVITGEQAAEEDASDIQQGLSFFRQILTVFGTIALLVGTFIIANTFQILVAQRTRELALLRTVGASRGQVLRSVLLEAAVVALVASALGVLAGIGLAALITALLSAAGADLPTRSLVIAPATIVIGLVLGLAVTLISAVAPAIRATRVPPLAALREVAVDRSGASRWRIGLGVLALAVGAVNLSAAWRSDGDTDVVPGVGMGALLLIVGAIVIGPALAGRTVKLLGALLPRLRGVTGRLATENAARSPKRTSATASALLIGVALIGFVTVFAESAKASVNAQIATGFTADLVIQPEGGFFGGFGGFSPAVADAVRGVEGIDEVASFAGDLARVTYPDGDTADVFFGAVDPIPYSAMGDPDMAEGEFTDLVPGTVLVDRQIAEDNALAIGDVVSFRLPAGNSVQLTISGISDDPVILTPTWAWHLDDFTAAIDERLDFQVFATVDDGADVAVVQEAVEAAVDPFPSIEVLDRDGFAGDLAEQLSAFVNVIYGLLGLSIVIAMVGVANTISLSVHERTRELGLLRAVGMTRTQLRSAIRWEAVLIAVLGTVVGLGLGLIASFAMIKALEGFGLTEFAVPGVTLAVQALIAAGLAVLASLLPARRAARLDVLRAIAAE